jgi:excisionase family DNA binding protein
MDALLVRPTEAARLLSVGRSQIYLLIAQGLVPAIRLGRRSVRVPVAELQRWITAQSATASRSGSEPTG